MKTGTKHALLNLGVAVAILAALVCASDVCGQDVKPAPSLPAGASGDWWTQAQKSIASSEYQVTRQEAVAQASAPAAAGLPLGTVWQAPNRAHDLRTWFTENGPRSIRRSSENPDWVWGLEFMNAPALRETKTNGNRIEFHREGGLIEWYVNDPKGLEQGFTIADCGLRTADSDSRIADSGPRIGDLKSSEIMIELAVRGHLHPGMMPDGKTVEFLSEGGVGLIHYGGLKAWDAAGKELPARMELARSDGSAGSVGSVGQQEPAASLIRLIVDAAGAKYPLTIDPVATSAAWTAEPDQASAYFGYSVSTAGDVNGDGFSDVIVGAPNCDNTLPNEGRAFLFYGSASGLSTIASWVADGGQSGAGLGNCVATAGDVNGDGFSDVIIAAYCYSNGEASEGRAYVYHGSASGLPISPDWSIESDQVGAYLGYSVATAGDVNGDGYSDVIVGAVEYDNGESNEGRAYVFHGSASGLATTASWSAEGDQAQAYFGCSVAAAGDVNGDGYGDVIVGAQYYDNGQSNEGRAYVYYGSASGLPTLASWTAEGELANVYFGRSVSTAGDVNGDGYSDVIVGAYLYDAGQSDEGRAFVYYGSATGLAASAGWTAESNQANASFGYSVATAGDVNGDGYGDVIVGAYYYTNGQSYEGRTYVYLGAASGLCTTATWTAESDQASAYFGMSVATAGDVNGDGYSDVIVGAYGYDNGQTDEGRAFVYYGSASGSGTTAAWTAEGGQASASFGCSVATAGDVNGDGYSDVIVGAHMYDNGQLDEGMTFVFHGSASGLAATPSWTAEGAQDSAWFGYSVATAGDVNGDGYSDVIIGAPYYNNTPSYEGWAYVYHGSASGLAATPAWTAQSNKQDAMFGMSVASAGDVNGDGYSDVVIGAPDYSNGQTYEGLAFAYYGSASGLSPTANWTVESDQANANLGLCVATAGDVNGDGYSDVVVSTPYFNNGQVSEGVAYVFQGSAAGLAMTPSWTMEGNIANSNFGRSAGAAGDVNGDGYGDVIIGADGYSNGQSQEGAAFVFLGSASGLATTASWMVESNKSSALFGRSVATAGDVNGDGYSDVLVGAFLLENGESMEGRAYVYLGSASGLSPTASWTAEGNQAGARFGYSVASAGDVNGDGYSDVLAGAYYYDNGESNEGIVFLYYGGGEAGPGLSLRPQLRRGDGLTPIHSLGGSPTFPRVTALGRTPYGRGKVKLEYEIKPFGTPFDGAGTVVSAVWADTGTSPGVVLNELASGLSAGAKHWRARLLYHHATSPFQQKSRWFSQAPNGAEEKDIRLSLPIAPGNPGGSATATDAIAWTWNDNSSDETGFKVWCGSGSTAPSTATAPTSTTGANAASCLIAGLITNTQYAFQVAATNDFGDSNPGGNYTTWTLIERVAGLSVVSWTSSSITVAATNPSFSNLTVGSSGLYYSNTTRGTNSGWIQSNSQWVSAGLTPNTQYNFSAKTRNAAGVETAARGAVRRTMAATPLAPVVNHPTVNAMDVSIAPGDGNPGGTQYAIYCATTSQWVQADGTLSASAAWQTTDTWGSKTVMNLPYAPSYSFTARARNNQLSETADSPAAIGVMLPNSAPRSAAWATNGEVDAIVTSGGVTYISGRFTTVNGQPRNYIAALDASGVLTDWNPDANDGVMALAISGSTVYAGGWFTRIGGQWRGRIAALDTTINTNNATEWNPSADNSVDALAVSGTTVYVGGSFTEISGKLRSNIAALDATLDTENATLWNPGSNGSIYSLAVSGTTVYAGGNFTIIGGQPRSCLAALDATVNTNNATAWNPNASSTVYALAISGATVYAGGYFTSIGGQTRNHIAALNATIATNNATGWNPNADHYVYALAVSGSTVYAGGGFSNIGGNPRVALAALDATVNANNATAWDPGPNNTVYALATTGTTVYAGGDFTTIGGQSRPYFAQFNSVFVPENPSNAGAKNIGPNSITWTWFDGVSIETGFKVYANPAALGAPMTLQTITPANTQEWQHNGLAVNTSYTVQVAAINAAGASDQATSCTTWTLIEEVSGLSVVSWTTNSITVAATNPSFSNLTADLSGLCFSNTSLETNSGWLQSNSEWVSEGLSPNQTYNFSAKSRNGAGVETAPAGISQQTMAAAPLAPVVNRPTANTLDVSIAPGDGNSGGTEYAIYCATTSQWVQSNGTLGASADWETTATWGAKTVTGLPYSVSYSFTTRARNGAGIETVDSPSAVGFMLPKSTPRSATVTANGSVLAIVTSGGITYIGGEFTSVNGQARNRIAAIDEAGVLTNWNPNANNTVNALAISGNTVYAGGTFWNIGGQYRYRLAALNASVATNNATAWDPSANSIVYTIAISSSTMYVGGGFTNIGGQTRNRIAALDLNTDTNNATAWDPNANNTVNNLMVSGSTVYAGGTFTSIGGQTRNLLAALNANADTNNATAWDPQTTGSKVLACVIQNSTIYVGGDFTSIGGQARKNIAALDTTLDVSNATAWDPNANYAVTALKVAGSTVYAGGPFYTIGGQSYSCIAALDATVNTNSALNWNPYANNSIKAFDLAGSTVYAGGPFTTIGGYSRGYFAQFDSAFVPASPANGGATNISANTITWTWTDNASNETGFWLYADPGTGSPMTRRTTLATDSQQWQHNSLSPNTQYAFQVAAKNAAGFSDQFATYTTWTLAATPVAPVVNNPTLSTLNVAIGSGDGNAAGTQYAIYCVTTSQWVQTDGSLGASAAWQTASAWGTKTVTGLSAGTYTFMVRARNGAGIETANGSSASGIVPWMLTVASWAPSSGVSVTVSPNDINGQGSGSTQFTRSYAPNTTVTLTAPIAAPNGNQFLKWKIDGADFAGNDSRTVQVLMNANRTITAVYHSDYPALTVASQNPDTGVGIAVYPCDFNSQTNGVTQFARTYWWRSAPTLTAPATAPNGYVFSKWLKDGADFANNRYRAVLCSMDTDHTMTAVFAHPINSNLLTIASSDPSLGVVVAVYPADQSRRTSVTTQYMCSYAPYSLVTLTAPPVAPNGFVFSKWLRDGADFTNNNQRAALCSMGADHTMTAVYAHPANTRLLTVASSSPDNGVIAAVYPADKYNRTTGTTQFVASYAPWTLATVTAPAVAPNGYIFSKWLKDGADFPNNTQRSVLCSMGADRAMTAVYVHPANTALLTVASTNPDGGVLVALYPSDKNNRTSGLTQFVSPYVPTSLITVTAPDPAPNGNVFVKWLKDGADFTSNTLRAAQCSMGADHTMTAVYQP